MRKLLLAAALAAALAAIPAIAAAAVPQIPSCFGEQAAILGSAGEMGTHSSSFDEPRSGIGNVAFDNTGTHQPGLLADFLSGFACTS
jgi:opacity protein-like surface antigen